MGAADKICKVTMSDPIPIIVFTVIAILFSFKAIDIISYIVLYVYILCKIVIKKIVGVLDDDEPEVQECCEEDEYDSEVDYAEKLQEFNETNSYNEKKKYNIPGVSPIIDGTGFEC